MDRIWQNHYVSADFQSAKRMKRFVIALPRANQNELRRRARRSLLPTIDVRKRKHRTAEFLAKAKR